MPLGPIGPLPAMPAATAGIAPNTPPLAQQLLNAYAQGHQFKLQREQEAKDKLQQLQQLIVANPNLAQDPRIVNTVKNLYKVQGLPAPVKSVGVADIPGGINVLGKGPAAGVPQREVLDVDSFSPKPDWNQAVANDPTLPGRLLVLEPNARKAALSAYRNYDQSLLTAPRVPTWQERDMALRTLNDDMQRLSQSNLDPNMFVTMVKSMQPVFDTAGVDTNVLLQDPKIFGNLTQKAQAQIEELRKAGMLKGAQYDEAVAKVGQIHSMEDLNKFREQYLRAETEAIPQRLQQGWQNIQLRAGELAVHQQNAHTMLMRVQNGDLSQLKQLRDETSSLNGMANSLNSQLNGFRSQQAAYMLANKGATSADLASKINQIQGQLDDVRHLQRQVEQLHPAEIQHLMHNNGATFTVNSVNNGPSSKPFDGQDPKRGESGTYHGKRAVKIGDHVYDASSGQRLE